ncbi:ATP synthase F0 subunit B [Candidatus Gracilibacteria bacterium]|nr:ATP synthase F0 subunit B [Candidatus Gracilibacteria bacterium]
MSALFDLSSFIIQAINFAVVAFVLRKFFFVPYMAYLDAEAIKRRTLEVEIAKSANILTDAHNQATNIIDQSKVDAKLIASEIAENARKESVELIKKAHADADAARSKGFDDIALERKMIIDELRSKVIDVALKMNEKLFAKNESNVEFLKTQAKTIEL